jgi:integrase/recombinase XerD
MRFLASAKVFCRYLFREKYISTNVSALLESPKLWRTLPSVLSGSDIDRLVESPDLSTDEGIRDRAILELLYGTGLRVSELCGLSLYDVSDDLVRVRGKGGKERLVPVGRQALLAIDAYLTRVRQKHDSETVQKLFVTDKGKPIGRTFVWGRVHKLAKQAGIDKKVSPHTFRHTYATHLLDAGADLRVIQDLLGHAHISSTDRYTHVSRSQIREVFRTFHPRWKAKESGSEDAHCVQRESPAPPKNAVAAKLTGQVARAVAITPPRIKSKLLFHRAPTRSGRFRMRMGVSVAVKNPIAKGMG